MILLSLWSRRSDQTDSNSDPNCDLRFIAVAVVAGIVF